MSMTLHNAIRSCDFEEIRAALENDTTEINFPDPILGWTPLYKAVLYRDYEITKILLEKGADPNLSNQIGENALHIAIDNNLDDIICLLISFQAKLDLRCNDGQSPIHSAILKKNPKIVDILLKAGAPINSKNGVGKTPLHLALEAEDETLVKMLLEKGADLNIQDDCGTTPLQMNLCPSLKAFIESQTAKKFDNNDKALKEKSLNLTLNKSSETDKNFTNINKQTLLGSLSNIQEKIDTLEQKKAEITDLSLSIENTLTQLKNPAPIKKKSINFEEFKEKHSFTLSLSQEPSVINQEACVFEINHDKTQENIENKPRSLVLSNYQPNPDANQPIALKSSFVENPISEKKIGQWLAEIHLEGLVQNFLDLGIENNELLLNLLKGNVGNWDKMLITHLGIDKPGHRKRIITKLKEDMGLCKRSGLFKLKNSNAKLNFLSLSEWLKSLNLEEWSDYFIAAGYDDYESLIFQMTTDQSINERILEEDIMIDDPLARMKICNQLMEDALKASEINAPDNFEGEISFEINERNPGNWKETCSIF